MLTAALEADPVSLDPHQNASFTSIYAHDLVYESLTAYDDHMNPVPALAEKWEADSNGTIYTFHLRSGVRFHDGRPLTAADVAYSLGRVLDPATSAPFRSYLGPLKQVIAVDPQTVKLVLEAPYPSLPGALAALRASAIVPVGQAERASLATTAVGTGPFKLGEFVAGSHLTYTRNPDYWDAKLPYLDGLTLRIIPDENARVAALQADEVQHAMVTVRGAARLKETSGVAVLGAPYPLLNVTYVNVSLPPLNDVRVRKALRLAVDTGEVIQREAFGAGAPSGPIPTGFGAWALDPARLPYLHADVDGARQLLAEAGYPDGKGISLAVKAAAPVTTTVTRARVMQEAYRKLGIQLDVEQLDLNTWLDAYQKNDYQLLNSGHSFQPDPDDYVYPYFHSKGGLNAGGYSNPKLDPLIDRARASLDATERARLYAEIQKALLDDCPTFWWYTQINLEAISTRLENYVQAFTGRRTAFKRAWLA